MLAATAALVVGAGCGGGDDPETFGSRAEYCRFPAAEWGRLQADDISDGGARKEALAVRLITCRTLEGKSREEVTALLGSGFGPKPPVFVDYPLKYAWGTLVQILRVSFDASGRVSDFTLRLM